jgi:cellulose synthase/poly-beta-1,6-N-acetylglucosamine synthase-like glycosyltransferase
VTPRRVCGISSRYGATLRQDREVKWDTRAVWTLQSSRQFQTGSNLRFHPPIGRCNGKTLTTLKPLAPLDSATSATLCTDKQTPSGNRQFVSVIIPHYNDLEALSICIAGLQRQTWPAEGMEIIVADNNSVCGLDAVIAATPGCRVVSAPVQGAGPARNAGAAVAHGEILAFIDSDCDPTPDWIENGVRALANYDFAGGRVVTAARNPQRPTPVEAWEMVFGFDFERYIRVEGYTGSGNMWVWRKVFEAVGGFRTGVAEDMDWSFRARRGGFRLGYEPAAVVSHLARSDWLDLLKRWKRVLAEHYLLTREKPFGMLRWAVWTGGMPLSIIPHSVKVLRSKRLLSARDKLSAVVVLVAHRLWRAYYMARLMIMPPTRGAR